MIPAAFRAELVKQAEHDGRTLSDVTRERLLRPAASEERLSPARALGMLVEGLAADVAAYSPSADEWHQEVRLGVPALIKDLFDNAGHGANEDAGSFGAMLGRTIGQKVRRAHLPKARSGDPAKDFWADQADLAVAKEQPAIGKLQQADLLKIQQALGLSPEAPAPTITGQRKWRK
jgi:hypothetical protein